MKNSFILLLVLFAFILAGCEESKPTEAKDFNNNLKDFNKSLHHVDKTMDLMDQMDKEMEKVVESKKSGAISNEAAERRMDLIRSKYAQKISKTETIKSTDSFPEWAKKLGLTAPENMQLDMKMSQMTSASDQTAGYNSVNFIYKGSYPTAMKQAEKIARKAGVPIGRDYQEAIDLANELNTDLVKGAVYMNFEIGKEDSEQYHIAITVDETGMLTITATDVVQLAKQLENSNN